MESLTPPEIERFLLFSRAYEHVENTSADMPVTNKDYEKKFYRFDPHHQHLSTISYLKIALTYIKQDLRKVNKDRLAVKTFDISWLPSLIPDALQIVENKLIVEKLKRSLTPRQLEVVNILEETGSIEHVITTTGLTQQRISSIMAAICRKLKIILT